MWPMVDLAFENASTALLFFELSNAIIHYMSRHSKIKILVGTLFLELHSHHSYFQIFKKLVVTFHFQHFCFIFFCFIFFALVFIVYNVDLTMIIIWKKWAFPSPMTMLKLQKLELGHHGVI
jgi:hypothetical protein